MTLENFKNLTTKQKVLKILFWLTFVPYIISIGLIIWGGVFGLEFFGLTNGVEGMLIALLYILLFFILIPVIPICLCIQIAVGIRKYLVKKNKSISLGKYIAIVAAIGVTLIGGIYLAAFWDNIIEEMPWLRAQILYAQADEIVHYDLDNDVKCYGQKKFEHATMMIDYDHYKIGFLYYDSTERYKEYWLNSMSEQNLEHYSQLFYHWEHQAQYVFDDGSVLDTYCDNSPDYPVSRTVLITLTSPDGKMRAAEIYLGEYLQIVDGGFEK